MSMKHISAARILQGSAKDISNLIECVGSLISLEWHQGAVDPGLNGKQVWMRSCTVFIGLHPLQEKIHRLST